MISAASAPPSILTSASAPPARVAGSPANPQPPTDHPAIEWWTVGSERFDSTQDLVDHATIPEKGVPATYHYYENPGDNEPGKLRRNEILSTVGGTTVGGVVGGVGGVACGAVATVAVAILTAGMLPISGAIALFGTMGALGGALIGGASGLDMSRTYAREGNTVEGLLRQELKTDGPHAIFYEDSDLSQSVDLNAYAKPSPQPPDTDSWWRTVKDPRP